MPLAIILILLLTGGTSYAAKDTVPGDFLYPVKINLNENVESLLALNDKQEAIVDVKQAARRLKEAKGLADKNNLTREQSEKIKQEFENKVNDMNVRLRKLTGKGDTQFISELNDKLEVEIDDHFDAFGKISQNATDTPLFSDLYKRIDVRHKRINQIDSESSTSTDHKMEDGEAIVNTGVKEVSE